MLGHAAGWQALPNVAHPLLLALLCCAHAALLLPTLLSSACKMLCTTLCCAGEAKLREAQLELQLSTRRQAADLELAQNSLEAHRAALVSCRAVASVVGCLLC
jgi:hypothetical protein